MALLFNASTEQVSHGGPQLGDPCTVMSWLKPSTVTAGLRHLCAQVANVGIWRFMTSNSGGGAGRMRLFLPDTTAANWNYITNDGALAANAWQCIAFTFDSSAAAGQQGNIYVGTLTAAMTEATYASFNDPAGTVEPTTGNLIVGRDTNGSFPFEGDIASIMAWPGTILTLPQLIQHQWRFLPQIAGSELFTHYGFAGTGTQPDWTGNGNGGTVTGATVSDHVPTPPPFAFDITRSLVTPTGVSLYPPRRQNTLVRM